MVSETLYQNVPKHGLKFLFNTRTSLKNDKVIKKTKRVHMNTQKTTNLRQIDYKLTKQTNKLRIRINNENSSTHIGQHSSFIEWKERSWISFFFLLLIVRCRTHLYIIFTFNFCQCIASFGFTVYIGQYTYAPRRSCEQIV